MKAQFSRRLERIEAATAEAGATTQGAPERRRRSYHLDARNAKFLDDRPGSPSISMETFAAQLPELVTFWSHIKTGFYISRSVHQQSCHHVKMQAPNGDQFRFDVDDLPPGLLDAHPEHGARWNELHALETALVGDLVGDDTAHVTRAQLPTYEGLCIGPESGTLWLMFWDPHWPGAVADYICHIELLDAAAERGHPIEFRLTSIEPEITERGDKRYPSLIRSTDDLRRFMAAIEPGGIK